MGVTSGVLQPTSAAELLERWLAYRRDQLARAAALVGTAHAPRPAGTVVPHSRGAGTARSVHGAPSAIVAGRAVLEALGNGRLEVTAGHAQASSHQGLV